jgi:hypothetical protein
MKLDAQRFFYWRLTSHFSLKQMSNSSQASRRIQCDNSVKDCRKIPSIPVVVTLAVGNTFSLDGADASAQSAALGALKLKLRRGSF